MFELQCLDGTTLDAVGNVAIAARARPTWPLTQTTRKPSVLAPYTCSMSLTRQLQPSPARGRNPTNTPRLPDSRKITSTSKRPRAGVRVCFHRAVRNGYDWLDPHAPRHESNGASGLGFHRRIGVCRAYTGCRR